jgi:hypothetical protein
VIPKNPPKPTITKIQPFQGSQEDFLSSPAKEVFYGGEAGGGKSFCLLMDAVRYIHVNTYKAIIFRRSYPDLQHIIGEAHQLFKPLKAEYKEQGHIFNFPSGAWIKFNHLNHVKDIYDHQGAQYDYIAFDELPQFPLVAYLYLFSRLRGVNPEVERYIRSTGNPDGEHLLEYKSRFIDKLKPYEIGYFKKLGDRDTRVPKGTVGAISRQWIPCVRAQNEALMKNDPHYEAMLDQLPEAKRNALKYGKWEQTDKPDQLIQSKWWERALSGEIEHIPGMTTFGFDYAEMGSDHCCLIIGNGNQPFNGELWPYLSHQTAAQKIWEIFEKYGRYRTFGAVDSVGTGAGVWTALMDRGLTDQIEPCRYKPAEGKQGTDKYVITFDTLRSEIWWTLKNDMEHGNIDLSRLVAGIDDNGDVTGYFQEFTRLQTEVLAITYTVTNGVLKVIPKSELRKANNLGRSPDVADAFAYWNWARNRQRITPISSQMHNKKIDYGMYESEDKTITCEASGLV